MNPSNEAAILIAESIATLIEAMGMKSENDNRISNGLSLAYPDNNFSQLADDVIDRVNEFKNIKA